MGVSKSKGERKRVRQAGEGRKKGGGGLKKEKMSEIERGTGHQQIRQLIHHCPTSSSCLRSSSFLDVGHHTPTTLLHYFFSRYFIIILDSYTPTPLPHTLFSPSPPPPLFPLFRPLRLPGRQNDSGSK